MIKKAKVCHLTSIHSRYDGRIFERECTSLSKHGYDVYLIVNDLKNNEDLNGVHILSTLFLPENRIERFLYGNKKIFEKAISINADIYQFHDPDLMNVGLKLKKLGKKVIYDMHEDVPIDIAHKEWIPFFFRKPISLIMIAYEKMYMNKFDAVFTVTPHICDRVKKMNSSTFMITNFPIISTDKAMENKSGFHDNFKICFAGAIVSQWQHLNILDAINEIEDIEYMLAGPCNAKYLNRLQAKPSWGKVNYIGIISHEEVSNLYLSATVGMALLKYSPTTGNKLGTLGNTKLFEYMLNELPVICSASKVWSEIINKYQCGILVNPENVNEIKSAILFLKNNPDKAKEMGKRGKQAVLAEFNWQTQEEKLYKIYFKIQAMI